jgi:glycosyltransferase involved in cell wall biosynthesis
MFAIDISSLIRWTGTPTGMIRAEQQLAQYAIMRDESIVLTVYDTQDRAFRQVRQEWARLFVSWSGPVVEREDAPATRRRLFMWIEKRRIASRSAVVRRYYERFQRLVLGGKRLPFEIYAGDGSRLDVVPYRDAIGGRLALKRGDVLFFPSSDWWHKDEKDLALIGDLAQEGVCISALCYDILPLTHPQWFGEPAGSNEDIKRFRAYWHAMFSCTRKIIVNSNRIRTDVIDYCVAHGLRQADIDVIPLGSDGPQAPAEEPLLAGLETDHFALFVSTIEPRKNHAMLVRVWRKLLAEGVPQRHGFKLVFIGRRGWNVDEVLRQLDEPGAFAHTLLHFEQVQDSALERLYQCCAFCLYPSEYEGFGLPVVEAFARGKAVIASNGGSLAEVVGTFSPCLDPTDEDSWNATLRRWIEQPDERSRFERRIAREYVLSTWPDVASRMLKSVASDCAKAGDLA